MVADSTIWNTPVKLEFNIPKHVGQYNVRENLRTLLVLMKQVDPKLKVISAVEEQQEWNDFNLLPEDEEFNEHFQLKEFGYRKFKKVTVYMKMTTSLHINRIKYRSEVKEHLFQNDIWFKPDRFETKVESSPGIITMVHPKLVNRDGYTLEIEKAITTMFHMIKPSETNDTVTPLETYDKEIIGDRLSPPKFYLESSVKKWRDIKAEVLRVNCAKVDSECLKLLLAATCEKGLLQRGTFVPEGLHLIEGKELVYTILQKHEQFTQSIIGVPLSGINYRDFVNKQPDTEKNMRDLIQEIKGVISVETLRDRTQIGRYIILLHKTMEEEVMKELGKMMESLYKRQTGQARMIIAGERKIRHPETHRHGVLTYAEILSAKFQQHPKKDVTRKSTSPVLGRTDEDKKLARQAPSDTPSSDKGLPENKSLMDQQNLTKMQEFNKLIQKIDKMATQQDKLEKAQVNLQKVQTINNTLFLQKIKQTEDNTRDDKINTIIDKKLVKLQAEQEKRLQETTQSLKKDIDVVLDKKIKELSDSVANQVGTQILDMFKQFMLPQDTRDTTVLQGYTANTNTNMSTNMITQDSPLGKVQGVTESEQTTTPIRTQSTTSKAVMADEVSAVDFQTKQQCSTHDNYINEQRSDK